MNGEMGIKDLAQFLQLSVAGARTLVLQRGLPARKVPGRWGPKWIIRRADLDRWLAKHQVNVNGGRPKKDSPAEARLDAYITRFSRAPHNLTRDGFIECAVTKLLDELGAP